MRNLCAAILFLASARVILGGVAGNHRSTSNRNHNSKSIESLTNRYALPTNVYPVASRLPFSFGYRFTDDYGTTQSREEKTDPSGSKTGSYSFMDPSGIYRRVDYIADHHGFRATVMTNEPGTLPEDPAHVTMRSENDRNTRASYRQAIRNSPQLEYSSNVFSRYNLSGNYGRNNIVNPLQSLGFIGENPAFPKNSIFDSERLEPPSTNFYSNINNYKGSSVPLSPQASPLLAPEINSPHTSNFLKAQRFNVDKYFNDPGINSEFNFDKIPDVSYQRPIPTRYPRRYRDSRPRARRKRPALKVHIPQGFESYPDLPLYRDK